MHPLPDAPAPPLLSPRESGWYDKPQYLTPCLLSDVSFSCPLQMYNTINFL